MIHQYNFHMKYVKTVKKSKFSILKMPKFSRKSFRVGKKNKGPGGKNHILTTWVRFFQKQFKKAFRPRNAIASFKKNHTLKSNVVK